MMIPVLVPPCLCLIPEGKGREEKRKGRDKPKGDRDGDYVRCYFMTSNKRGREAFTYSFHLPPFKGTFNPGSL